MNLLTYLCSGWIPVEALVHFGLILIYTFVFNIRSNIVCSISILSGCLSVVNKFIWNLYKIWINYFLWYKQICFIVEDVNTTDVMLLSLCYYDLICSTILKSGMFFIFIMICYCFRLFFLCFINREPLCVVIRFVLWTNYPCYTLPNRFYGVICWSLSFVIVNFNMTSFSGFAGKRPIKPMTKSN